MLKGSGEVNGGDFRVMVSVKCKIASGMIDTSPSICLGFKKVG